MIEDWEASHVFLDAIAEAVRSPANQEAFRASLAAPPADASARPAGPPPREQRTLSRIAFDLVMARASGGEAIAEVSFGPAGIVVTRGPADLDVEGGFVLRDLFTDHFGIHPDTSN